MNGTESRKDHSQNAQTDWHCHQGLSDDEAAAVTGGIALGPRGFHATTMLEVLSVLDGSRGSVMFIVDGVIMNKDELGMI